MNMIKKPNNIFRSIPKQHLVLTAVLCGTGLILLSLALALVPGKTGNGAKGTSSLISTDSAFTGSSQNSQNPGSSEPGALSGNPSVSAALSAALSSGGTKSQTGGTSSSAVPGIPVVKTANLTTWSPPAGTKVNNSYSVFVRESGSGNWIPLFVYSVKIGHQEGNDPLRSLVGMEYNGPVDTSMVNFDFNKKVELKIVYQKTNLETVHISPESYQLPVKKEKNTLYLTLEQNQNAPRKLIVRPNGDWEKNVLHIVTNPVEKSVPKTTDSNVFVVEPGKEAPRVLPEGKTVYYFKPGVHVLPKGSWTTFDLGKNTTVDRFDFITGAEQPFTVPGAQDFRIEYMADGDKEYKVCYEAEGNAQMNLEKVAFSPVKARYIRLILLGNNAVKSGSGYNYLNSNHVKEFRLYEKGTSNNVVLKKATDGSSMNYYAVCDGNDSTNSYFGHIYSAESFFAARDGYQFYLAPGSIVKGAVNTDWKSNITIKGRGILDCSGLVHDPAGKYAEGRTSAIRSEYSDDILIEGITILDSPMWAVITNHSQNPVVRNLNMFGSIVNSDGIHMSGVTNGLVEGCFIRTTDDLFVMYHYGPASQVTVRNSVFFSDGGRIVLLGMANSKGDIENVIFENNDILNVQNVWDMSKHGGAFSLWASGGNTIRNIVFKNVRIEAFREPRIACLFQIKTLDFSGWGSGKIDGVTFDHVSYNGTGEAVSYLSGDGSAYPVSRVLFKNFLYGGKPITQSWHPGIEIRNDVSGITYSK